MTDELIIEQPSSSAWLNPAKRLGHLVAIFNVASKEKQFDTLSGNERIVAEFDFVDLNGERLTITASDNHPGITTRLKIGNPAVVLGRITSVPNRVPGMKDAYVLAEHEPQDAEMFRAWFQQQGTAKVNEQWPKTGQSIQNVQEQRATPQPQPQPVPQPQAQQVTGNGPAVFDPSTLDPATLALIQKALQQQGQQQ